MRWGAFSVAVAAALVASAAGGQSLEQSYAQMCTEANKGSEACVTLRKALIEKLSGESGGARSAKAAAAKADKPLTKAQKAKLAAPWGPWAELAGNSYDFGTAVYSYSWKVPYEVLLLTRETEDGRSEAQLTLSGDSILIDGSQPSDKLSSNEYVSFNDTHQLRVRYVFAPGGRDTIQEKLENGQWVVQGEPRKMRLIPDSKLASVKSRVLTARMEKDRMIAEQWGAANRFVGKRFLTQQASGADEERLDVWGWADRGRVLENKMFAVPSGKEIGSVRYERNPADGSFFKRTSGTTVPVTITAMKISVPAAAREKDGRLRTYVYEIDSEGPKFYNVLEKDGQSTVIPPDRLLDVSKLEVKEIFALGAKQLAQRKQALAQAEAAKARARAQAEAQARAEAEAQAQSDAGWLGALGGAIVGTFAGGNTEQVIGAAMKGAAIANPNSELAQGLDRAGDALITGDTSAVESAFGSSSIGGVASSVGASALGGGGGGAAKPPVSMNGCAQVGITASNYQGADYTGGNDVQLKTLCAAAYSYYTAYENAVGQGMSAADAEPAYQSHAKAAAVANQFYSEARTD